jgi:hypothetical protein
MNTKLQWDAVIPAGAPESIVERAALRWIPELRAGGACPERRRFLMKLSWSWVPGSLLRSAPE